MAQKNTSRDFRSKSTLQPHAYTPEELDQALAEDWKRLSKQAKMIDGVLEHWRRRLFRRKNVVGLHRGLARRGGELTKPLQYALVVHLRQKTTNGKSPSNPVDTAYDDVPTDIIEMDYRPVNGGPNHGPTIAFDPIRGGAAISKQSSPNDWGTLGLAVKRFGEVMLLTNEHVVGKKLQTKIIHPPEGVAPVVIGTVHDAIRTNRVDAAVVLPDPASGIDVTGAIRGIDADSESFIGGQLGLADEHRTRVFKIGAATGWDEIVEGVVEKVGAHVQIGNVQMNNQILVSQADSDGDLIAPGDSGSVLIRKTTFRGEPAFAVVGLVHAETADQKFLVASDFADVRNTLAVELLTE